MSGASSSVRVRDFQPDDGPAFKALNLAWIEQLFEIEPSDLAQLENPQGQIIDRGGRVLIADLDGVPVGTAGLLVGHEPATLELVKMSAREDLRGLGIGKALIAGCIQAAREMGAARIWLESNRKLDAALGLYRASGFRELTCDEMASSPYSRCDIQMVLTL
ncbi:GNAT family N-acetyltransferase [Henriciella mobilis]|uniref:GNAT family N-acetyltransferase n=1 Tax=Henriciella mobilis TaxID=2305467 RepID=A0A399RDJ6_9PROT|nr:GNAT family N-acetyltransferase [Henriciella mobilis]RIJ28551.1 GNAT family N-acetyltransferase [Henriciella mobilis]